jgi:hypothetical protein
MLCSCPGGNKIADLGVSHCLYSACKGRLLIAISQTSVLRTEMGCWLVLSRCDASWTSDSETYRMRRGVVGQRVKTYM